MRNYLLSICHKLGLPPTIWMMHNPIKIYEYLAVTKSAGLGPHDVALDLGCGSGVWTMDLARHCKKVIGVDPLESAVSIARDYIRNSSIQQHLEFHAGRLEELGVAEDSLDHMFSFCVLEHIDNLEQVLTEAQRLLRPGGRLHVSVDSLETIQDSELIAKHKRDHVVVQYFTVDSLRRKLEDAGFIVQDIHAILKSGFARQEFEKRIRGQSYEYGWFERKAMVEHLEEDDRRQPPDRGIMIVAHAVRP